MSDAETKELLPAIRFEGFEGRWHERTIGSVLTEIKRPVELDDDTVYQLVTVKRRNGGVIPRALLKGRDILVKSYFELKSGDYLISKRQVVHGSNGSVPDELNGAVVSNEYLVVIDNEDISTNFWTVLTKRPEEHKRFFISSYGVDIEKLVFDVEDWKKRSITIPKPAEQNEITLFFQHLDESIAGHRRKREKLLKLKKSLLGKMFPKQGQDKPEIRFAGFDADWVKSEFASLADIRRGLTYKPSDLSDSEGVRVLRSSNIDIDRFAFRKDDVFVSECSANINPVANEDILITSANGSSRLVGKHAVVQGLNSTIVHGGFMLLATAKNPYFLNASMSSEWYYRFLKVHISGGNGAIGNLSKNSLERQSLYTPEPDEQTKIGVLFKYMDTLIHQHQTQITKLLNIKQACLAKMFV